MTKNTPSNIKQNRVQEHGAATDAWLTGKGPKPSAFQDFLAGRVELFKFPQTIGDEQIRADFKNLSPDTPDRFTMPEIDNQNLDFDSDFDLQKAMVGPGCPFPDDSEPEKPSYLPEGWPDPIKAMRVWQWVMFITLSMFLSRALYVMNMWR